METQTAVQSVMKAKPASINGLNVDQMMATVEALKADPMLAQFEFRARNRWIDGGENRSTATKLTATPPRSTIAPRATAVAVRRRRSPGWRASPSR